MDPHVQQAMRRMAKANRRMIVAMGALMLASLQASKAMENLNREVERSGHWKEATPDEADQVDEELADMVATYSSQVN